MGIEHDDELLESMLVQSQTAPFKDFQRYPTLIDKKRKARIPIGSRFTIPKRSNSKIIMSIDVGAAEAYAASAVLRQRGGGKRRRSIFYLERRTTKRGRGVARVARPRTPSCGDANRRPRIGRDAG